MRRYRTLGAGSTWDVRFPWGHAATPAYFHTRHTRITNIAGRAWLVVIA